MQSVGSGFGENLDAPVADAVELRRKRILIDADLADRRLGRQLPASKAVDINLSAVRSSRGAGQSRQLVLQFVRIVGKGFEVFVLQNNRGGVGPGLGANGRSAFVGHNHLHIGSLNRQFDIYVLALAGAQRNRRRNESGEAGIAGLDHVTSCGEPTNRIAAGGIGGYSTHLLAVRRCHGHLRTGNQRPGGVEDMAMENAGRRRAGLRRGSRCRRLWRRCLRPRRYAGQGQR